MIPFLKADTPPTPQATPNAIAELIEALKIWKLANAVSPTSEQEVPLLTKFNKLEKFKAQYRQQHRSAMNQLKQLQATEIDSESKIDELQTALARYREVEDQFIFQRKKIMEELSQILTVEQQAQFAVFSYSYRQELKKTLQTLIALQELGDKGKVKDVLVKKSGGR